MKKNNKTPSTLIFSHLDKILFPKSNITKKAIITYYQNIAPWFLSHAGNHLMVMHRFPEDINHEGFYQKQISDYFPSWINRYTVDLKKGGSQTLLVIDSATSLMYLANQLVIEFHSWLSSSNTINKPDKIVFDLDPSSTNLKELHFVALQLKNELEQLQLIPFIMTTGSRGYHIAVPIKPLHTFDIVHEFAKNIAQNMSKKYPDLCTTEINKSKRDNKVFIDYLRNSFGQTSIACYSVRAYEKAPIATPIAWNELRKTDPQKYNIKNIFKRLAKKDDPWKDFSKHAKKLILK